jgi:mannosyltransferase
MLLYYLVMHVVVGLFGTAAWVMRVPSVIANGVTGAVVAALALRLFPANRRLATAAGLLAVASLPLVFWGQNVRGYAWLVALSAASFLALIVILQTPPGQAPARGALVAYVLSTLAAFYVGYDVALLLPAQLALLLLHRERARLVISCLALVLVLCVPLLVLAAERGSGQLFWVTPLSWRIVGQALLALVSAALVPNFHRTATTVPTVIVMGLAVLAGIGFGARAVLRTRGTRSAEARSQIFILAWVLVPSVLTLLAYAAGEPIELPRVTILELPALALLVAWLLLRPQVRPMLGMAGVTVVLALRLLQVIPSYGVSPEPWKAATAYAVRAASPGTCVVFYPQDGREAFDYYLNRLRLPAPSPPPTLRPLLPRLPWRQIRPYVEQYRGLDTAQESAIAGRCPRLLLIASHPGQANGTRRSVENLNRYRTIVRGFTHDYGHHTLRTFGWASPIHVYLFSQT